MNQMSMPFAMNSGSTADLPPGLTAHEARAITRRAEELATEGFDNGDDIMRAWLADEANDHESAVREVLLQTVLANDGNEDAADQRTRAVERLRELFITDRRDEYMAIASLELDYPPEVEP